MSASDYVARGWHIVPIANREKKPTIKGWPEIEFTAEQCTENVGVHLGPSGLIDIDLDCPEAIDLAPKHLPATATFGRGERGHWLYAGEARYRKFIDPIDRACILEIRAGVGKQTVLPPSFVVAPAYPDGETVEWLDEGEPAALDDLQCVANLAALAWMKKHPGAAIPDKVRAWVEEPQEAPAGASAEYESPIFFEGRDAELVEAITACCPDGNRHDYRLAVAGAMKREGIARSSASEMLAAAMADDRLGDDRANAVTDARAAVRDTYSTTRATTGIKTLVDTFGAQAVIERIEAVVAPNLQSIGWLEKLEKQAVGGALEPLEDTTIVNGLARLLLCKDPRLPTIWAKLKDGGYQHLRELKQAVEYRMAELRKKPVQQGPAVPINHPESNGMSMPVGYWVDEGTLKCGEETILHGEFVLLAKCPAPEGMQVRFAFRSPSQPEWRHSIAPYRALVDTRGVLVLAEHGVNVSSLESQAVVGYVRDYVAANEKQLDRPVATATGWHDSGAFVWGRNILFPTDDLTAEYAADNEIAIRYVEALRPEGDRAASFAALGRAVTTLPTAALCVAASLSAAWNTRLRRPAIGVHLAGMGGRGKTRTLKIAGSVWGGTGGAKALAAGGTIAGANTTQRALEIAASVRCDLPLLVSDVQPFPGLPEVMHSILNGDARARATNKGGSTLGRPYRCGAVITEGELNVLSLTTRQGFHRRMLELEPDDRDQLWELGVLCSEHYGHLGPAFLELGALPADRLAYWEKETAGRLGHDGAAVAATMLVVAEHCAGLLGVEAGDWQRMIVKAVLADRTEREASGATQSDRVVEDLGEILADLAPQIADTQAQTDMHEKGAKPWLGYREGDETVIRTSALRAELIRRGHDAVTDVLHAMIARGVIVDAGQRRISRQKLRCYLVK